MNKANITNSNILKSDDDTASRNSIVNFHLAELIEAKVKSVVNFRYSPTPDQWRMMTAQKKKKLSCYLFMLAGFYFLFPVLR